MSQPRPAQLRMHRPHLDDLPPSPQLPDGYEVRRFEEGDDEDALAATLTAAFGEDWSVDRVRRELTHESTVTSVFVVSWQGSPVATASSRYLPDHFPNCGYVHWVGTHPDHAGRGLGLAVFLRLLADFRERGYDDAVLETDDFRLPAVRTYLRCGFVPVLTVKGEDHRPRWSQVFQSLFARRS